MGCKRPGAEEEFVVQETHVVKASFMIWEGAMQKVKTVVWEWPVLQERIMVWERFVVVEKYMDREWSVPEKKDMDGQWPTQRKMMEPKLRKEVAGGDRSELKEMITIWKGAMMRDKSVHWERPVRRETVVIWKGFVAGEDNMTMNELKLEEERMAVGRHMLA